jgi:hypothetical protein
MGIPDLAMDGIKNLVDFACTDRPDQGEAMNLNI